jgi:tetratricopeptide (TPR) repeat protein
MVHYKGAYLLLAAALLLSTGKLWADNPTPVATSTTPAATKSAKSPAYTAMVAANDLAAAGKTDEAVAAYEKIGVLKSKSMEAWRLNNEAHAYLTAATPVPDKAVSLLEKAVAANDENYVAWNNLGSAYELTDQIKKAQDAYQKSIDTAKAANASSAKAEGNLQALQPKLDKLGDDKPDAAGNSPAAASK